MKKLIYTFILLISFSSFGQYSSYYGAYDINANVSVNANINKNVNVTGNVNKTITTIDYGALANANAIRERNRIESRIEGLKIANERDKEAMIAIANDPSKAFDYGKDNNWTATKKQAQERGFKKFTWYHKIPHQSLFSSTGGYNYQNISDNYITTEIELTGFFRVSGIKDKNTREIIKNNYKGIFKSVEEFAKSPHFVEGEYSDEIKAFIHKKDINKTKLYGVNGFKETIIYENDYEIVIKDNYVGVINGIILRAGVRYKADKDEATFEDLEGRRFYFRKLVDKIISTSLIRDIK